MSKEELIRLLAVATNEQIRRALINDLIAMGLLKLKGESDEL